MKKHKICIIGDGLSGLITAQILGKLDIEIDLISKKQKKKFIDNRTTAISPSNYNFISNFLLTKRPNLFFGVKKVSLFYEEENKNLLNFMNFKKSDKNLMLIAQNKNLRKIFLENIKKNKRIKIFHEKINEVNTDETWISFKSKKNYYDMIFLCVGKNYKMVEKLVGKRFIKEDKNEVAFTCNIKHNLNLVEAKQYFFKEGPMALLPINRKELSLIWSMDSSFKSTSPKEIKNLINKKFKKIFLKKGKFSIDSIGSFPIYFKFNKNFYKNNTYAIGESGYNVYPVAGQGFNLVLRDIESLFKKIKEYLSLGLELKNSLVLNDLNYNRKPENLFYGLGINLTQNFFRYNEFTFPVKSRLLRDMDKFVFLKKIGLKIADTGILN